MKINLVKIYDSLAPSSDDQLMSYISQYRELNDRYKYFLEDDENMIELYVNCNRTISSFFKDDPIMDNVSCLQDYTYKLMALFSTDDSADTKSTLQNFQKYCTTFFNDKDAMRNFTSHTNFDSDLILMQNAEYGIFDYDITDIKNALKNGKMGHAVLKHLDNAPQIQKANNGKLPTSKQAFENKLLEIVYPGSHQNMELAKLCMQFSVLDGSFLTMLDLMKKGVLPSYNTSQGLRLQKKQEDNLPEVYVEYINEDTGTKYNFVKLASDDFRSMMLGSITGNCQTLNGGDASAFIIDGITRPNNGFYVMFNDKKEIVGQSYAWIGRDGKSITLEAPQFIKDRCPHIDIPKVFEEFGRQLEQQGYDRVTIGQHMAGIGGAKNFTHDSTYKTSEYHNIPQEGQKYHFTTARQYETYSSERLNNVRATITELTKFSSVSVDPKSIVSVKQGEALIDLINGDHTYGNMIHKYLFSPYVTQDWSPENLKTLLGKLKQLEETNDPKLGLITGESIKSWWVLGMTMDDVIDLPNSVIELLNSIQPCGECGSIWEIIQPNELVKNIKSAKSVSDIKREGLKLAKKYLYSNEVNSSYIDNFSDEQIEALSSRENLPVSSIAIVDFKISDCQFIKTQDVFDFVVENILYLDVYYLFNNKHVQDLLQEHSSLIEIKREILPTIVKFYSSLFSYFKFTTESLPDFAVDLLMDKKMLNFVLSNPEISKKLCSLFNESSSHDADNFKCEVLKCITGTEKDLISIDREKLDILILASIEEVFEHNAKLSDIFSLETIEKYTSSQLKILLSKPALLLYIYQITSVEQLASFDIPEIQTLLSFDSYNRPVLDTFTSSLKVSTFETIAKKLCPNHSWTEVFEVELREKNNQIYEEMLQAQESDFLYDQYEFEF